MSQNDDENWTHFNVRCEKQLREKAEADAKFLGQSLSEWIRRAMMEKLMKNESSELADGQLTLSDMQLKETVRKLMLEIRAEEAQRSHKQTKRSK